MRISKSILLVEDDTDDQEFFLEVLSQIENVSIYHVASNGREALARLDHPAQLPDLIFMDINMPLMNGIECLVEIHKDPLTNQIPVIILSTSTAEIELVRSLGAQGFMEKQFDLHTMKTQLEEFIKIDFTHDFSPGHPVFMQVH